MLKIGAPVGLINCAHISDEPGQKTVEDRKNWPWKNSKNQSAVATSSYCVSLVSYENPING